MQAEKSSAVFTIKLTFFSFAGTMDTVDAYSTAVQKFLKAAVVLPGSYAKSKTAFRVLYLLHSRIALITSPKTEWHQDDSSIIRTTITNFRMSGAAC